MKHSLCQKIAVFFLTVVALSAPAQVTNRIGGLGPPARQVIVSPASFSVFPGTNNQAQALFDWMDDYWPAFTNGTYLTMPSSVSNIQMLVNWIDTNSVGRSMTNVYYPASNPSNYLDNLGVVTAGNTNWLSITNRLLTVGDVTNEIGYASPRFVGFNIAAYGYTYSVSSSQVPVVFGSSGQFATNSYTITSTYGVGAYTNSRVIDTNSFTTAGQLKFAMPGYYQLSFSSAWVAPADLADVKYISLSLVHNAGGNVATLASGAHVEVDPQIGRSGLFYVSNTTNVYTFKYEMTYVFPKTNISLSVSGVYLGN